MLYFAYGSNLNHHQMKKRCKGSKYLKKYTLNGYKLIFSHKTKDTIYGHANIIKNKNSRVFGALWDINKKDESELDGYEGVDYDYYQKEYFYLRGKKVLVYVQQVYFPKKPNSTYLHTIIDGYKDCNINVSLLKKTVSKYDIDYKISW
tara:strand:+ start:714 stop:1157 length:444 start_codon:yes stop_codon:yes gene_type:complete